VNIKFLFFNGRPIIGLNVNASFYVKIKVLIKLLPHNTAKKTLLKFSLLLITFLGLDRFLMKEHETTNAKILMLTPPNINQVLIRFHSLENKSRCYCYFIDNHGVFGFFGKISFDELNTQLMKKECHVLKNFNPTNFKVPKFENEMNFNDGTYGFLASAINNNYKVYEKNSPYINASLLGNMQNEIFEIEFSELIKLEWYKSFIVKKEYALLFRQIESVSLNEDNIKLSHVHGDLGSENLLLNTKASNKFEDGNFYIIDWERYCEEGPYLTDALGFWLGYHHKTILSNTSGTIQLRELFFNEFIIYYENDKYAAFLALAFLVSVDFDLANVVARSLEIKPEIEI